MTESARAVLTENLDRNAVDPVRTFGRTCKLAADATGQLLTGPFRGRLQVRETVLQAWFLVSVTAIPALLMAIPFGIIVTVQIGNIINQLGAESLLGAGSGIAVIQQAAPLTSGLLLAGAGASAIAADLGARTVREEVDAMEVMGIDPVNRLVVPRLLAALVVAPLLTLFIILIGVLAAFYLAVAVQGVGPGSYLQSFSAFSSQRDVLLALGKAVVFGFIIAIVGSQRGLEAKGGPQGVANGVTATVVISTVAIIGVNFFITALYETFFPMQVG